MSVRQWSYFNATAQFTQVDFPFDLPTQIMQEATSVGLVGSTVVRQLLDFTVRLEIPTGQSPGPGDDWPDKLGGIVGVGVTNESDHTALSLYNRNGDKRVTGTGSLYPQPPVVEPVNVARVIQSCRLLQPIDTHGQRKSPVANEPPKPILCFAPGGVPGYLSGIWNWTMDITWYWRILFEHA